MFNIYARSLMTATRINTPRIRDFPVKTIRYKPLRRRWWNRTPRQMDLSDL